MSSLTVHHVWLCSKVGGKHRNKNVHMKTGVRSAAHISLGSCFRAAKVGFLISSAPVSQREILSALSGVLISNLFFSSAISCLLFEQLSKDKTPDHGRHSSSADIC